MKPDLHSLTAAQRAVVTRLRSPLVVPARVVAGYSSVPPNFGYVLGTTPGQDVVAVGDGTVETVTLAPAKWRYSPGSYHATSTSYAVVVDHGQGMRSVVHGLSEVQLSGSSRVGRGTRLGSAVTDELFVGVEVNGNYYDLAELNRHLVPLDGNLVPGRSGFIVGAPNLLAQAASSVSSFLLDGIRYFVPAIGQPLLWSVAFNGNGQKTGPAAIGVAPTDYWNVYSPIDFEASTTFQYAYCYALTQTYAMSPLVGLRDHAGQTGPVCLERVSPLQAVGGNASSWDEMLKTWIGGWNTGTPYVNTFGLRGLPAGTYQLFLYANQGTPPEASSFYVSVAGGTPTLKTNTPTGVSAFVENANYVRYVITVGQSQQVLIRVYGFLSGLQIYRG